MKNGSIERLRAEKGTGRPKTKAGYILLTINGKRMYEHRHVMEQKLGRKLLPGETVHHDGVPVDQNKPEKLILFKSQSEHAKYHSKKNETLKRED